MSLNTETINLDISLQSRADLAANWQDTNPKLLLNEVGYEKDTGRYKIGDGVTHWNDLEYQIPITTYHGNANKIALSSGSVSIGNNNVVGCKGYYIKCIDYANKIIYITETPTYNNFNTVPSNPIEILDVQPDYGDLSNPDKQPYFSIIGYVNLGGNNENHFHFCGKITKIENNAITYLSELPFDRLLDCNEQNNERTLFLVPQFPDQGSIPISQESFAEGVSNKSSGWGSHAEGRGNIAAGQYAHAEGRNTKAGYAAHAEGLTTTASGMYSHSEGGKTSSLGKYSHAEGNETTALGMNSHAEGNKTTASGMNSHAEGAGTWAEGSYSHAEGMGTEAKGIYGAHAEGNTTHAFGQSSHAEGSNTYAKGQESHAEGHNTMAINRTSHAEGYYTRAEGEGAHAEGRGLYSDDATKIVYNLAVGIGAHVEGSRNKAIGIATHAEGYLTEAIADYTHTEGNESVASAKGAHAEGKGTTASGSYSHAEGSGTTASNNYSHSEGSGTTASGQGSHAEGTGSQAMAYGSHAEGDGTQATVWGSHTEGIKTRAVSSAQGGHAEGYETYVSGQYGHAEGNQSFAEGKGSHAEGEHTFAKGKYTHSEGSQTFANSDYQHVQGRLNIQDNHSQYLHIVGNGFITTDPALGGSVDTPRIISNNAHTLDWEGNAHFAGSIYGNTTYNDDGSINSAKQLATKDEVIYEINENNIEIKNMINNLHYYCDKDIQFNNENIEFKLDYIENGASFFTIQIHDLDNKITTLIIPYNIEHIYEAKHTHINLVAPFGNNIQTLIVPRGLDLCSNEQWKEPFSNLQTLVKINKYGGVEIFNFTNETV